MPHTDDYCPACPRKYRPLSGDGPRPAQVLLIGERPGKNEHRYGIPFIGKSGQELDDTYLPLAGWRRENARLTNCVKCWADNDRTPSDREIEACSRHHLPRELALAKPQVVVLLGATACSLVPSIDLERHHGVPREASLFDWRGVVVPMYHPAVGLRLPRFMTFLLEDWGSLQGELERIGEESPSEIIDALKVYRQASTPAQVRDYFNSSSHSSTRFYGVDTESHAGRPWSVQASVAEGTGILVRSDDTPALAAIRGILSSDCEVALHNAAHDLEVLRRLSIRVPRYRDTMQEAYHLGNLPQSLKSLSYRLFRAEMRTWEDIVWPDSIDALQNWLMDALMRCEPAFKDTPMRRCELCGHGRAKHQPRCLSKACLCESFSPIVKSERVNSNAESLLRRLLKHCSPSSEYDPWERLDSPLSRPIIDSLDASPGDSLGSYPLLGIANCSIDRAVEYACGDADYTRRAALKLKEIRDESMSGKFSVHPSDWDCPKAIPSDPKYDNHDHPSSSARSK